MISGCGPKQTETPESLTSPPASVHPATPGQSPVVQEPSKPDDPAAALTAQLSLPEKLGQMVLVGMEGAAMQQEIRGMISDRHVGGIILYGNNIVSPQQLSELVNELKKANRETGAKLPLLLSADQEGGRVSRLPQDIDVFPNSRSVGNTNDPKYAFRVGTALGEAMKAAGFNTDFAPVLDVNTNPANPVIGDRSFGTTAQTVSEMGVQEMLGIKSQGVIPVVKHFPGHGDTSVDSHFGLPIVDHDLERLRSVEFVPFAAAIKEDAPMVMVAHILMTKLDPNTPSSMSSIVIGQYLRNELQYKGVVITDDMTMEAIGKTASIGAAAVQAVLAGADIVLVGHDPAQQKAVLEALADAVDSGKIPQKTIDESVNRIAKLKLGFGLTDEPVSMPDVPALNKHIRELLSK
ncbi:beta-N-acetylhexosaminidase [Paenibacillus thalictri]|uniref:Beta-N-acetylhexosaminidase n=2 Tax=Paenibacillus thalictri TaxID=2527873 RepID=A0A4Q9DQH6_9BACL|nr:beta-N-acetylhexosaminidase [Paenibacillus thalictri]